MFFGKVNFQDISGEIVLNAPTESGMFGFGHHFEKAQKSKGIAEFVLKGKMILNGPMHMGKDVFLCIENTAGINIC